MNFYNKARSKNRWLSENENCIPKECPWALEQLMAYNIIDLVEMLPNQTEYYLQYIEDNPSIHNIELNFDFAMEGY